MDTNNKRVFTIACRNGVAILTDSKVNKNTGKGSLKRFINENKDSQMACLDALIDLLNRTPKGVKFDHAIAILLPSNIAFLAYENTRTQWLSTGKKKSGIELTEELLNKVRTLDTLIKAHGRNIQLFNQTKLTSNLYKMYRTETWKSMNKIVPVDKEVINIANADF